jgi:hypothetical protein
MDREPPRGTITPESEQGPNQTGLLVNIYKLRPALLLTSHTANAKAVTTRLGMTSGRPATQVMQLQVKGSRLADPDSNFPDVKPQNLSWVGATATTYSDHGGHYRPPTLLTQYSDQHTQTSTPTWCVALKASSSIRSEALAQTFADRCTAHCRTGTCAMTLPPTRYPVAFNTSHLQPTQLWYAAAGCVVWLPCMQLTIYGGV